MVPSRTTALRNVLIAADILMPMSPNTSPARFLTSGSIRIVVVGLVVIFETPIAKYNVA